MWIISKIKNKLFYNKVLREGGELYSTTLRKKTKLDYKVDVGLYSYGGCFDPSFNLGGNVNVGRYCSFAQNVHYFGANHPIKNLTMSPLFYNKKFGFNVMDIERNELNIGNDVWIGYGVIITASCREIGNGAVIGAGSIVTKNVPPYAIVAGNPAKIIKYRFDEETISKLQKSDWVNHTPKEIYEKYAYISNIDVILEELSK